MIEPNSTYRSRFQGLRLSTSAGCTANSRGDIPWARPTSVPSQLTGHRRIVSSAPAARAQQRQRQRRDRGTNAFAKQQNKREVTKVGKV